MLALSSIRSQFFRSPCAAVGLQNVRFKRTSTEKNIEIPEKPKKPRVSFFRFFENLKPQLSLEYPGISQTDVIKKAAERWKEADEHTKAPFIEMYNEEFQQYISKLEAYNSSLTEEQKTYIKNEACLEKKRKEDSKMKKMMVKLGKPKRPPSSFGFYVASMKHLREDTPVPKWMKVLSEKWKILSDAEKEQVKIQAEEARVNYEKEMKLWLNDVLNKTDLELSEEPVDKPKKNTKNKKKREDTSEDY